MTPAGFMWECSCGFTDYSEEEIDECSQCGKVNSFIKMPEEIVEEREREMIEESQNAKAVKPVKMKSIKSKSTKGRKKK